MRQDADKENIPRYVNAIHLYNCQCQLSFCLLSQYSRFSKDHFNIMIANQRALMKAPQYRDDPSKLVFMRIQPDIATLIYKLDPQFAQFRAHDGSLVVELDQALYGCIQSALLWHTELSTFLRTLGLVPNDTDPCVYNRTVSNIQITVAVYVDDLIITCSRNTFIDELTSALRSKYKEIKVVEGLIHNYLGMVLDFSQAPLVANNQTGMIEDIINTPLIALNHNAAKTSTTYTAAPPKSPAASCLSI